MEHSQEPNSNPFASVWGRGATGNPFRQSTQGARVYWNSRMQSASLVQRVIGGLLLILMLGVGVVLGVLFLIVGAVAAVGIAALLLARKAVRALTGNSRDALNRARGTDNDGRRNVTVVER